MAHHHFGSCQGALLSAAASSTGIHLRCSGQLLFPVESQEDVKRPLQRSMIAEVMERDNQIS